MRKSGTSTPLYKCSNASILKMQYKYLDMARAVVLPLGCLLHAQLLPQEACRVTLPAPGHLFGLAAAQELASACATLGPQVNHVVGTLDDIQVVLDDDERVAALDECVEGIQQAAYVVEVKSGGGLVEDEHRGLVLLHAQVVGQFHALVFAA